MSTRCIVYFHEEEGTKPEARVYRHYDGYPDVEHDGERHGMLHDLARFFEDVAEQTGAVGYDAGHLAAQYVVWESANYNRDDDAYRRDSGTGGPLNFTSVHLMRADPGDIEYRYHVYPTPSRYLATPEERAGDRPRVTYDERIGYSDEWRTVAPQTPEERERDKFLKTWRQADEETRALIQPHLKDQPRLWLEEATQTEEVPNEPAEPEPEPEPEPEEDVTPEEEITAGGFRIVEHADGLLYSRDPNRENGVYEIVRPEQSSNQHAVIVGDKDRLTVLNYLNDGDGHGRSVYLASKGPYKTLKGARKRARDYLKS